MKLALPKKSTLYDSKREPKLAIASRYIDKNKKRLHDKKVYLKPGMVEFLKSNINDLYIKQYCDEFGITKSVEPCELNKSCIETAVKHNKVCLDQIYEWNIDVYDVITALCRSGTVETFNNICKNESTRTPFLAYLDLDINMKSFLFNLVNYTNNGLLHYIMREEYEFKTMLQPSINIAVHRTLEYICDSKAVYFPHSPVEWKLIITYFSPSKDQIQILIEKAEENFSVDVWMYLMNHLATL